MVTGPVMGGRAVKGVIVCAPLPMLKLMPSEPALALAALMASRRVQFVASQTPSFVSALEFTVKMAAAALGVIDGAVCFACSTTRSLRASAFSRMGSTATGALTALSEAL